MNNMAEKIETKKETTVKPKVVAETKKTAKPKKDKNKQAMLDALDVIMYPHLTEKSINNIEVQNKLVFIVKRTASKMDIKHAVETGFEVKVKKVNVLTTTKGLKKAIVSLTPEYSATDIATKLGMM